MTVKQKQHLLAYLGYYDADVDGNWGPLSEEACISFQRAFGLEDDGVCGKQTEKALKHAVTYDMAENKEDQSESGTFWDEIEFFDREEFRCKCGGKYCNGFPAEPKESMVRIADQLRRNLGVPITVVSGLRCSQWNSIQGGVDNSQHMFGEAVDIWAQGKSQAVVEAELDRIGGVRYHYPIDGSSNVHFDIPKGAR
jgi:hypothetical protein